MKVVSVIFFLITMGCCIVISGFTYFLLFEYKILHYPSFAHGDLISYKVKAGYFLALGTLLFFSSRALFLFFNTFQLSTKRHHHLIHGNSKEINELRLKSNPHILYNYLHNTYKLLREDNINIALKYTDAIHSLLTRQLSILNSDIISLDGELNWIKEYLACEKIRLGEFLNYDINVQKQNILQYQIPPFIIQPVVESMLSLDIKSGKQNLSIKIEELPNDKHRGIVVIINSENEKKANLFFKNSFIKNWEKRIALINNLKEVSINYKRNTSNNKNSFEITVVDI